MVPMPTHSDQAATTQLQRMQRITMVCSGNICRSPMAEVVLRQLLDDAGIDHVEVTSSGMGGWHVGERADPRTIQVLHQHGYDGAGHRASQFDPRDFAELDLVLAADNGHVRQLRAVARAPHDRAKIRLLREFDPVAVIAGQLEVDDPYYGGADGFERCLAEVEAACRGIVEQLAGDGLTPRTPG